jgi:hypothetical protein
MLKYDHPYRGLTGGAWRRGNLHAHTTNSDGQLSPQRAVDGYAKLGYDFLAITDHDVYTNQSTLRKLNARGMILIPGNEITANGSHIVHVNADRLVPPSPQRQEAINRVKAGRGFAIIAHPNRQDTFNHTSIEMLREWIGYNGIEIFNGAGGRVPGSPYSTHKWDMLLSDGRRFWGYANDDSHQSDEIGLGWSMVYTRERSAKAILEAVAAGRFYASTGVIISAIRVRDTVITIETENAGRIVAISDTGGREMVVDSNRIDCKIADDATYVRFECWGEREQFAWTQPFFVK